MLSEDSDALLDQTNIASSSNDRQVLVNNASNNDDGPPRVYLQYISTISATFSALAAGTVLGWTSPILDELQSGHYNGIKVNDDQMGWIGSFATLGALTMCIPTGFICDIIGRKRTLLLLTIPFLAGWLLIIFARNILMLYFGRIFTGMALGATCVAAPLYTGEIAHKNLRGALGSYFQLMIVIGVLFSYVFGKYLTALHFTISCSVLPIIFLVLFSFQPETPVYLIKRGLHEEARTSMVKLRGPSYNIDAELYEIEECLKETMHSTVSVSQLFRQRATVKATIILLALMFFQQFSGVNTLIFYISDIFSSAQVKIDPKIASIIVGGLQVVATLISSLTIDRLGRRFLLLTSSSVLALSAFGLAFYFTLKDRFNLEHKILGELGFLPVGALSLFIVVFSLGLGPIPWMISSEILAPEVKSVISSIAGTFNLFSAFLITKFFLQLNECIGEDSTFYIFAVISLCGTVFIYLMVPETKGKTIVEVQAMLEG